MICTDIGLIRKSKGFTTRKNIAMAMHGEELRAGNRGSPRTTAGQNGAELFKEGEEWNETDDRIQQVSHRMGSQDLQLSLTYFSTHTPPPIISTPHSHICWGLCCPPLKGKTSRTL